MTSLLQHCSHSINTTVSRIPPYTLSVLQSLKDGKVELESNKRGAARCPPSHNQSVLGKAGGKQQQAGD